MDRCNSRFLFSNSVAKGNTLQRKELSMQSEALRRRSEATETQTNNSGYVKVDVPEEHRSLFHDFLKGFEDFAALKGYRVTVSIDSSNSQEFGFKFTIMESGITVSTDTVREDFNNYMQKIESGAALDDLPIVASPEDHDLILTKLKNRINFLQHSYNLSQNTIEYYERLLKNTPPHIGFQQSPPVIVQTGGQLDSRSVNSSGSGAVVQANSAVVQTLTYQGDVVISNSYNDRKNQIEDLSQLIKLIRNESDSGSQEAAHCLLYTSPSPRDATLSRMPSSA